MNVCVCMCVCVYMCVCVCVCLSRARDACKGSLSRARDAFRCRVAPVAAAKLDGWQCVRNVCRPAFKLSGVG